MKYGYARVVIANAGLRGTSRGAEGSRLRTNFQREGFRQVDQGTPGIRQAYEVLTMVMCLVVANWTAWRDRAGICITSCMSFRRWAAASFRLAKAGATPPPSVGRLMMTIMGGIAEFERGLIRQRCEEGIERARRKGTKFGRPTALDPSQRRRVAERYAAGETMAELAPRVRGRRSDGLAGAAIATALGSEMPLRAPAAVEGDQFPQLGAGTAKSSRAHPAAPAESQTGRDRVPAAMIKPARAL